MLPREDCAIGWDFLVVGAGVSVSIHSALIFYFDKGTVRCIGLVSA